MRGVLVTLWLVCKTYLWARKIDVPMVTSIKVTLIVPLTLPQAFPSIKVTLKCDVVFPQWISQPLGEALNLVK